MQSALCDRNRKLSDEAVAEEPNRLDSMAVVYRGQPLTSAQPVGAATDDAAADDSADQDGPLEGGLRQGAHICKNSSETSSCRTSGSCM